MKLRALILAMALLVPASALADPIAVGVGAWQSVGTPLVVSSSEGTLGVAPFWSGTSWDCSVCGINYILEAYGLENLEYLHNGYGRGVDFYFDSSTNLSMPVLISNQTAWQGGIFGRREDGAFTYDSRTGHVSNSREQGEQYALFRVREGNSFTYFMGIEDILVTAPANDFDHNDFVVRFSEPAHSVPEPGTLLLMATALAAAGARKLRAQRKARTATL